VDEPPALVVELSSPGTARTDQREKLALYERFGVREYWIVDPVSRRIDVLAMSPDGKTHVRLEAAGNLHSRVFPDFVLSAKEVFCDL
jgi:Uma2 family endonuclease